MRPTLIKIGRHQFIEQTPHIIMTAFGPLAQILRIVVGGTKFIAPFIAIHIIPIDPFQRPLGAAQQIRPWTRCCVQ